MATGYWLSHKAFFCAALALQLSVIRSLNPKILRGAVHAQVFLLAQTCNPAHVRRCECPPWGGIHRRVLQRSDVTELQFLQ